MNKAINFYAFISKENKIDTNTVLNEMQRIISACNIGMPLKEEEWILSYVNDNNSTVSYTSYGG